MARVNCPRPARFGLGVETQHNCSNLAPVGTFGVCIEEPQIGCQVALVIACGGIGLWWFELEFSGCHRLVVRQDFAQQDPGNGPGSVRNQPDLAGRKPGEDYRSKGIAPAPDNRLQYARFGGSRFSTPVFRTCVEYTPWLDTLQIWPYRAMTLREVLAQNLKRYRAAAGLSQEELAHRADIDRTYVSSLERCQYAATVDVIEKLARELDIDPSELLNRNLP